jgi:hypothetical protein
MASFHLFFNPFAEAADFSGVFKYFQISFHVFSSFFHVFRFWHYPLPFFQLPNDVSGAL